MLVEYSFHIRVHIDLKLTDINFRLFTVLLGGWPFRWWMRLRTEKVHYTLLKLIEVDHTNSTWLPPEPTLDDLYER